MRFALIDQVLERGDDRLVAVKNVTSAEEYLADHFPSFPVLPGVMMLETLVQAARLLLDTDRPWVLTEVRNIRYGHMVKPGESLRVQVKQRKVTDEGVEFEGEGSVNDNVAVQGRFRLSPLT